MTAQKPSLVFFGNEVLATGVTTSAPVFRALLDMGYEVKAVVMSQSKVTSRSYKEPLVAQLARDNDIPLIDDIDLIPEADFGVLVAYGRILPKSVLDAFPHGIINVHPSLLPQYRGPTPIEQTILDSAPETGVSIISLSDKMDAGPVYTQAKTAVGDKSKQTIADELADNASHLLKDNLGGILSGELEPEPQAETAVSYTKKLSKDVGVVDWSKSAVQLAREVRAYAGWPKSRANIHKHDVILTKVRVADNETDGALIQKTGDGWFEIQELIAPSGRVMSGSDFLRGYA